MIDLLPPWPLFSAFLVASLVLALTPGPGVLYIVARSLLLGRGAGAPPMLQGAFLGALFVAIAALTDTLYALGAGFIGLGMFAALTDSRSAK